MPSYYKATRPDGTDLGELVQNDANLGVIRCEGSALAQVARSASQGQIVKRVFAARRNRNAMVNVEHTALDIEELEDTARADLGLRGAKPTVLADTAIPLGHFIAEPLGDVPGVTHSDKGSDRGGGYTRDLIGKNGYTQAHHDLLMELWRKVIGEGGNE